MSVNLSMCMNVDVTTNDQLLNPQRGHVVGRHAVSPATEQFRDDPWTRCAFIVTHCVALCRLKIPDSCIVLLLLISRLDSGTLRPPT